MMTTTTFGSTERPDELPEHVKIAQKVRRQTATIEGCSATLQIQAQQIKRQQEELNTLKNLFMTLQGQFQQFQTQRAIELQGMVNAGPTVR